MKLIERSANSGEKKHESAGVLPLPERTIKQGSEDRVFGQMRAFANEKLNGSDGPIGNVRRKPTDERSDESRGVLGRQKIGRADKHENYPRDNGQPEFQEGAHQKPNHRPGGCANLAA